MIKITPAAAEQIRKAAEQIRTGSLPLRLAAKIEADGKFEYGMGFDERREDDVQVTAEGIDIIISSSCKDLLVGATLDYVEINPGEHTFIVANPNDPAHGRPTGKVR